MINRRHSKDSGFTIIELMLSMTVFSLILVGAAAGLIQIGRMYYQSVIASRTQDTTRAVTEEISNAIQFSGNTPIINNEGEEHGGVRVRAVCVGNTRYSYVLNQQLGDVDHVLWRDEIDESSCVPANITNSGSLGDGVELMGEHMRLFKFDIRPARANDYSVEVFIAYGDNDLLVGVDDTGDFVDYDGENAIRLNCDPGGIGTQFCAIAELKTLVARRL